MTEKDLIFYSAIICSNVWISNAANGAAISWTIGIVWFAIAILVLVSTL